mgnify:CR=1 FL=1
MIHIISVFSRKYRPLKYIRAQDCVDLSQMLAGKLLQMSGAESVSNEQSLPPYLLSHVHLPEIYNIIMLSGPYLV